MFSLRQSVAPKKTILKENRYKRVELIHANRSVRIRKTFAGHSPENLKLNAAHTFKCLQFFQSYFKDEIETPKAIELDELRYAVEMEYMPEFERASRISFQNFGKTRSFFEKCYNIKNFEDFLPSIQHSVLATPKVTKLLQEGFPMRLGFKGDLHDNLRLSKTGLILVDVETTCIEPLGLSELILFLYISLSPRFATLFSLLKKKCLPVCLSRLTPEQSQRLFDAALELFHDFCLSSLTPAMKSVKISLAHCLLRYLRSVVRN